MKKMVTKSQYISNIKNQFLPRPRVNWGRYGIVRSERLGCQLLHWPLKMASLVYEREIGIVAIDRSLNEFSWLLLTRRLPSLMLILHNYS